MRWKRVICASHIARMRDSGRRDRTALHVQRSLENLFLFYFFKYLFHSEIRIHPRRIQLYILELTRQHILGYPVGTPGNQLNLIRSNNEISHNNLFRWITLLLRKKGVVYYCGTHR